MSAPGSSGGEWPRVQVHPGPGVVDRHGDLLLVVPALPPSGPARVRELLELCHRPAAAGEIRAGALPGVRASGEAPAFALLVRSGRSLRVHVHGAVRVLLDGHPPDDADDADGLSEHVVEDDAWHTLTVSPADTATDHDALDDGLDDGLELDLRSGAVRGAGVTLHRVAAPATGAAPDRTGTGLQPTVRFRSILLGECAVRTAGRQPPKVRPPLPVAGEHTAPPDRTAPDVLVDGVHCPSGHFTDPDLATCLRCGAPLPPGGPTVRAARPPLGVLVTDGGTVYPVTGDVVIGREPEQAADVLAGRARALPLRDEARSTSRVHARLTLQGWTVLLRDEGSANGTFVSGHGAAGPWLPLPPATPLRLAHGDRVRLGRRQLLFDAWREAALPQVLG